MNRSSQSRLTVQEPWYTSGRITLAEWADLFAEGHHVGAARTAAYRSHLKNHILPNLGHLTLARIDRRTLTQFANKLKDTLADSSVTSVMSLLTMLMREAVADRRITHNPCENLRLHTRRAPERPHAAPAQINEITARIDRFDDQVLVIAAAYSGMRWGELVGLARTHVNLATGIITIDPRHGALHEVGGKLELGPPKTADSARDVHLPPFLTHLLAAVLNQHDQDQVFVGARGGYLRRSNFNRRVWTPAVNGNPASQLPAIISGMHFHDLRHTHKTWLIEDDIPEIAQARRLGHRVPGVRGIYSHVTPAMQQRITDALQHRWRRNQPPSNVERLATRRPRAA